MLDRRSSILLSFMPRRQFSTQYWALQLPTSRYWPLNQVFTLGRSDPRVYLELSVVRDADESPRNPGGGAEKIRAMGSKHGATPSQITLTWILTEHRDSGNVR